MVHISPEVQILSTLYPGSVFYFEEESFSTNTPHYFVVLNKHPQTDVLLLMVYASSQISKVHKRSKNLKPDRTLIEVSPNEYPGFTKQSIFDCNYVLLKNVEILIEKLRAGSLKLKPKISNDLLIKLRQGVLDSPAVEEAKKRIIR